MTIPNGRDEWTLMMTTVKYTVPRLVVTALACLFLMASDARANPMFSVTDLGIGGVNFSIDGNGNEVVVDSTGRSAYQFNPTSNFNTSTGLALAEDPVPNNFPLGDGSPAYAGSTYGNPKNADAAIEEFLLNKNGIGVALEVVGNHGQYSASAYYAQQNSDGTWGAPTRMWGLYEINGQLGPLGSNFLIGISGTNSILGRIAAPTAADHTALDTAVYDINHNALTDLDSYLHGVPANKAAGFLSLSPSDGWYHPLPIAIDEDGRILLQANAGTGGSRHTLLLTPDGTASDPIPVPEPSSWTVLALASAAWATSRFRTRRWAA